MGFWEGRRGDRDLPGKQKTASREGSINTDQPMLISPGQDGGLEGGRAARGKKPGIGKSQPKHVLFVGEGATLRSHQNTPERGSSSPALH